MTIHWYPSPLAAIAPPKPHLQPGKQELQGLLPVLLSGQSAAGTAVAGAASTLHLGKQIVHGTAMVMQKGDSWR